MEELEKEILGLENDFQQHRDRKIHSLLVNKKLKYNTLCTYRAEKDILRTRQRYYKLGDRAHSLAIKERGEFKNN